MYVSREKGELVAGKLSILCQLSQTIAHELARVRVKGWRAQAAQISGMTRNKVKSQFHFVVKLFRVKNPEITADGFVL